MWVKQCHSPKMGMVTIPPIYGEDWGNVQVQTIFHIISSNHHHYVPWNLEVAIGGPFSDASMWLVWSPRSDIQNPNDDHLRNLTIRLFRRGFGFFPKHGGSSENHENHEEIVHSHSWFPESSNFHGSKCGSKCEEAYFSHIYLDS